MAASADGHAKMTLAIGEAGLSYELARWKFLGAPNSVTTLDAYAGMRYWLVDLDLQFDVAGAGASELLGLSQAGALTSATATTMRLGPTARCGLRRADERKRSASSSVELMALGSR